jgi:hypothetical protein
VAPLAMWPSASWYDVGTPDAIISQLNALPAGAPVNASMVALRRTTHDSGSGWVATPFLCDSFIHNSTPVYPGAHHGLLGHDGDARWFKEESVVRMREFLEAGYTTLRAGGLGVQIAAGVDALHGDGNSILKPRRANAARASHPGATTS